ncbi:MAG: sensor histidine kinase [Bacteroidota bacterium]
MSLIFGMLGFAILAGGVVFFNVRYQKNILKKQRELHQKENEYKLMLIKNTIEITETERKRIAGDLHDEIGSHLSTIRMLLNNFKSKSDNPKEVEGLADESKSLLDNTISSVRTISHNLLPPGLEKFGLVNTLEDLCSSLRASASVSVELNVQDGFPELSKTTELALYRIAQELTTNSLRHSKAIKLTMNLNFDNATITFSFQDDGVGIDEKLLSQKKGLGLLNIETRAIALNGKCTFTTATRKGFKAIIEIPG